MYSGAMTMGKPSRCRVFIFYGRGLYFMYSGATTEGKPSGSRVFIFYGRGLTSWTVVL